MSDFSTSGQRKQTYRSSDNRGSGQQNTKKIIYTCWRCEKSWDSETKLPLDTVRCPHCGMIHGQITNG